MVHQKNQNKIMSVNELGSDWLQLNKVSTSELNALDIETTIDYILIRRLKFDSKLDNIPPFIKKIYIESVKIDKKFFDTKIFKDDAFKIFKNPNSAWVVCKSYNYFEKRYQPFFIDLIKVPFSTAIKHYQECTDNNFLLNDIKSKYFNNQMIEQVDEKKSLTYRRKLATMKINIDILDEENKAKNKKNSVKEHYYKASILDDFLEFVKLNPQNTIFIK
jgi:hypothetical protein